MRFALDLIFISRDGQVIRVAPGVLPWRIALGGAGAWGVLELQAGWFPWQRLAPGVRVTFARDSAGLSALKNSSLAHAINPDFAR